MDIKNAPLTTRKFPKILNFRKCDNEIGADRTMDDYIGPIPLVSSL